MHNFLSDWSRNYIGLALFGLIVALLSFSAVFLFTSKDSRAREWLLTKSGRMKYVGVTILALVWLGFFIYNRATST
jgi:UDP-N-acetylmuramyl pentapeptide phosphotransferase/UDP-N-acetylglucosamine-1-phosphate transferase